MTRAQRLRRHAAVTSILVGVLVVAGTASAYWSAGGSGAGSGGTGTTTAVRLDPAVATAGLYPGGSAAVHLTVSNSNPEPVRLDSLDLDTSRGAGGFAVDDAHAGCAVDALSFTPQTNAGAGFTVPARSADGDGTVSLSLVDALAMSTTAADACQGASFTVYLRVGP